MRTLKDSLRVIHLAIVISLLLQLLGPAKLYPPTVSAAPVPQTTANPALLASSGSGTATLDLQALLDALLRQLLAANGCRSSASRSACYGSRLLPTAGM